MRVTYNRELIVKHHLDALGIECFVPMKKELDSDAAMPEAKMVPAINNLIFVHSTQRILTDLKMTRQEFHPLRYMMKRPDDLDSQAAAEIMRVPDRQMENFMRVAGVADDSIVFLEPSEYIEKIGKKVKILAGQFKDVVGVIKRIKKNRYFVVRVEGIVAVALTTLPRTLIAEVE